MDGFLTGLTLTKQQQLLGQADTTALSIRHRLKNTIFLAE